MSDAVIVSTARTPIGKAFRGAFNKTHGAVLAAHAISHAVERARVEPGEVEDVIMGCGLPEGATGHNVARLAAIRAGLPVTTAGTTINRFCSSGLQAISVAAQRVLTDRVPVVVAGGVESISLVQNSLNKTHFTEEWLMRHKPALWMNMIDTAEIVATRYGVDRDTQDAYALLSQQRTAAAQAGGRFDGDPTPHLAVILVKALSQVVQQQRQMKQVLATDRPVSRSDRSPLSNQSLGRFNSTKRVLVDSKTVVLVKLHQTASVTDGGHQLIEYTGVKHLPQGAAHVAGL